jgi:aminodeoxychorismate lyase
MTPVIVFLNGEFVPEERAVVSVFDRSFLYGDGLFEAIPIVGGRPFRWAEHLDRFARGAALLKIRCPFSDEAMRRFADELVARNKLPDALLRITLSRGVGQRGYSPKGADTPTLVMNLHPLPPPDAEVVKRWKLITASQRLPAGEPMAQFKNANKLPQILARIEADEAGANEALLQNSEGWVVEGTTSNLFWIKGNTVNTPPLVAGILPGVTRAVVQDICRSMGIEFRERNITIDELKRTDGVFLSMSSMGVVAVESLDDVQLPEPPLVSQIHRAYCNLLRQEQPQELEG